MPTDSRPGETAEPISRIAELMSVARRERANALRALAMDAVQAANSGHPGMPMGMADIAEVLWTDHLRHDPANPCLLYTSPSPRDLSTSRMPSSA